MSKLLFITTNKLKLAIANKALHKYGIEVENIGLETPELQAFSSKTIVEHSVKFAYDKLKQPVVKTDVEYCINSLKGFPGPYAKYIDKWLTAQDILNMMKDKKDRSMEIKEYLCYYDGKDLKTFLTVFPCKISDKIIDDTKGSFIDKINIRQGFDIPQNMLTQEQLEQHFINEMVLWDEFAKYYLSNKSSKWTKTTNK